MEELFRTNDPTMISFASALLAAEGIDCIVFDVHTSAVEGSLGFLPRRVMAHQRDVFRARSILRDNGFELPERRDP